jgi:hypothetical protein
MLLFYPTLATTPRNTSSTMKTLGFKAPSQLYTTVFTTPSVFTFTVVVGDFICTGTMNARIITLTLINFYITKQTFISFIANACKFGNPVFTFTINTGLRGTLINVYLTIVTFVASATFA